MIRWWEFRKRAHCPHVDVGGVWGDRINDVGGWRNQCRDCERYLDGPVSISQDRQRLLSEPDPSGG